MVSTSVSPSGYTRKSYIFLAEDIVYVHHWVVNTETSYVSVLGMGHCNQPNVIQNNHRCISDTFIWKSDLSEQMPNCKEKYGEFIGKK